MRHFGKFTLALFTLFLLLGFPPRLHAQNGNPSGTPHGIFTKWNAPSPVGGSGTIQGYYLFRCIGTLSSCTLTSGTWVSVGSLLPATPTNYLDPASGLAVSTSYVYAVATVDSAGNQSSWNLAAAPAVVGSSFPSNPNPPGGCNSTVQ